MRKFDFVTLAFGILVVPAWAGIPQSSAVAHEGHMMECNETSMNTMTAHIQAMPDGEAKTKAMQEMEMAKQMMANNKEGCETHMDNAMEAMGK